jgi:FkbH-like protein
MMIDRIKEHLKLREFEQAMNALREFACKASNLSEYEFIHHTLDNMESPPSGYRLINIAILRSFTIEPWLSSITANLLLYHIVPRFWVGDFDVFEDYLEQGSPLLHFQPDLVILAFESRVLMKDLYHTPPWDVENCFEKFSQVFTRRFESLTSALAKLCSARIIAFNLVTPAYDYFSPASSQESHSLVNVTRTINCALTAYTKQINSLSLFDIDYVSSRFGLARTFDKRMWYYATNPFTLEFIFEASKTLSELISLFYIPARKCIVLDLDNTLWGGILGEDGEKNLKIGLTFPGVLYREFQIFLKGMRERGILLAINSKNNENDCLQFLRTSPEMFLKETDFSSCKINWKDKVSNMQEIAEELNLGLDSFVFIDDNPYECELVKSLLPQVMVYQMPTSPLEIPSFISELYGLKAIKVLDEDKKRSEYYLLDKQRKQFEQKCHSADEYFHKLHMKLTINTIMAADIPRVAQLTQKTNQFNLTTRRYSESDIKKFMNERSRIYTLRMKDVFGEYGLVGVAILTNDQEDWIFNTLLFSCRVLGRSVEYAFVNFCIQEIKNIGGQFAIGEYIKTEKNEQVKDFYLRCNFKLLSESDPVTKYIFDPTNDALIETPDYFTIQIN